MAKDNRKKLDDLMELYRQAFYLNDEGVIPIVCAVVISNRMKGDPVFMNLVGASSGGKSELINAVMGAELRTADGKAKPFVHQVSDLTTNTLLSGMNNSTRETSLLLKIGNSGVLAMKDFTSILSSSKEKREILIAQLREVFDKHIVKETGTGRKISWKGKINFLGGVTETIYLYSAEINQMGARWTHYHLEDWNEDQQRLATLKALSGDASLDASRLEIRQGFAEYLSHMLANIPVEEDPIPDRVQENIIKIVSFASVASAMSSRNFRGEMVLAPGAAMPMRLAKQLSVMYRTLRYMNDNEEPEDWERLVYKLAYDTIPKQNRQVMEVLVKYPSGTTAGVATSIGLPSSTVRTALEDLNVYGVIKRTKKRRGDGTASAADMWVFQDKYRAVMEQFTGLKQIHPDPIESDEDEDSYGDAGIYGDPLAGMDLDPDEKEELQKHQEEIDKLGDDW